MEKNSRTEMLPGKRDFYRCSKARRSASHVNKEFWQQFQNYAPPSLRAIRTKFARTIIYNWRASEASETLSGLFNRESRYMYTRNVLLSAQMGERASVVLTCIITSRYNEVK